MQVGSNSHAAAHTQNARGPQTQTTPPAPESSDGGVTVTLSQTAQSVLKNSGPGNSGNSPAHMAAAAAEDHTGPFGQLVKTFAPGYQAADETSEDGGEIGDAGDTGDISETDDTGDTGGTGATDGGDTTVADGSDGGDDTGATEGGDTTVIATPEEGTGTGTGEIDPAIVVEEPDITEILDEFAPTDGETSGTGGTGSGETVASTEGGDTSDGGTGDGGTTGGTGEPVAVADTGDVIGDLLDQLDDNDEEIT